jgi:small-conductance mechanosensitive channel
MLIALAAIRLVVYALRGVVGGGSVLKSSERAIAFTIWGFLVLYFVGVLPEIGMELDQFEIPFGKQTISLLTIVKGAAVGIVTLAITLWVSGLIEQRLMKSPLDENMRVVLAKSVRALMITAGILFALQAVGFDLTLLSVFGGALGVGIGLGLQKLAANYIAGFTILLDRSIRMGDMVTVDNRFGGQFLHGLDDLFLAHALPDHSLQPDLHQLRGISVHTPAGRRPGRAVSLSGLRRGRPHVVDDLPFEVEGERFPFL